MIMNQIRIRKVGTGNSKGYLRNSKTNERKQEKDNKERNKRKGERKQEMKKETCKGVQIELQNAERIINKSK